MQQNLKNIQRRTFCDDMPHSIYFDRKIHQVTAIKNLYVAWTKTKSAMEIVVVAFKRETRQTITMTPAQTWRQSTGEQPQKKIMIEPTWDNRIICCKHTNFQFTATLGSTVQSIE